MSNQPNQPGYPVIMLHSADSRGPAQRAPESIVVPPRVHMAMQFISMLNAKTAPTIVGGGGFDGKNEPQEFKGPGLTPNEASAHNAASALIAEYFQGKYEPDLWEKPVQAAIKRRNKNRGGKKPRGRIIMQIHCPECGGSALASCKVCGGDGRMVLLRRKDL